MDDNPRDKDLYQRDEYQNQERAYVEVPVPPVGSRVYRRAVGCGQAGAHFATGLSAQSRGASQPRDRQPLIAAAATDQDTALEALWQAIQLLEDRLQPVLAPIGPQGQGTQGAGAGRVAPAPSLPPLAEQLQIATRKIQAVEFKIRELVDRVEV